MKNKQGQQNNLVQNMPDGFAYFQVVLSDNDEPVDYICLQINSAFSKITGLTEEMIVGKLVSVIYPGIDSLGIDWLGIYAQLVNIGKPIELEHYFELFGKWLVVTAYLDQPRHVGVIVKDIDERMKIEEKLSQEQREKELILNNLAEQVAYLDPELRIIWINADVIKRHNLEATEYEGQKCYELYHGLEQPCSDCYALVALETGETATGIHQSPDNRYWKMICVPVHNQNGEIIGVMDTALEFTDLVNSKLALQESESFARTIMDNMPIGLSVNSVDPKVTFTYMNDNFLKFYHTTREALSESDAFWDVVYEDPHFRSEIKQRVLDDCASGNPERMKWENVPITRDGRVVAYINATNTPVLDQDLMISTVWDVTDRIRAEEILKDNYALLRLAGEKAKFGGWSVDLKANKCTWSDQVAIIHEVPIGFSPPVEEGISFYAPEWREKINAVFTACAEEGISYDEELEIITAKGRRVWVRTVGEAVKDAKGKIIRVHGSFQDISEHKKTEEALKQSEDRYDQAMSVKNEGIWVWDLITNDTYFDKRYYTMAGYQPGEFPSNFIAWAVLVHEDDLPAARKAIDEYLSGDSSIFDIEFRFRKKDDQWMWINGKGKIYQRDENGKPLRMIGTHTDITDRKLAEEEINKLNAELEQRVKERTVELEAVNKELESFAYSVSHDFRAPLRALDGFSASLVEKYSDQFDEQGLHYLSRIRKAAIYMSNLVDDLLKLSRVTRTEVKKERVNLSRLASEALTILQESELTRKVEVSIAANLSAEGDPHLLRAAMDNLLGNAWKFSSNEARARIEVGQTVIDDEKVFYVCDNGVGFNMAYADKLFGAFQRLHGVDEFPGTGIGLATVQRIINRHGGRIWAESEVGKGATFYYTLPG